ncbi:MAG: chemotaxis protein CheX [Deltaproteobacteria bacterium]|nr:chemotaxis protein CheX [Deltaproteobacteria bacterium]
MLNRIIAIDCSPPVINVLNDFLGDTITLESLSFKNIRELKDCRMIILQEGDEKPDLLKQIRKLRYACHFRNIPIIVFRTMENKGSMEPFITAGATEVISLQDPPAAIRQILSGHLIPNRQPLKEETEYIDSFVKNTCAVLKTVASLDVSFEEVYFDNDFKIFGDVSGLIALTGGAEGILGITFYWPLAQTIIARMMGTDEDKINAELIHDGVAEIVNMIGGTTKKDFVGQPYHFEISLPSVIVGSGHQLGHSDKMPIAVLVFRADSQYFAVQICLKPDPNGKTNGK